MKLLHAFVADSLTTPVSQPIVERAQETAEELLEKKQRFAELYLREPKAFEIACIIYPDDMSRALRVSNDWPEDAEVKTFIESLREGAAEFEFHPTKEQFARKLLNHAEALLSLDPMTAHKYHDSYRKMRWPDKAVEINDNRIVNNVLVVKDHGTPDEWEAKAVAQQRRLKEESVVSTVARTTTSDS